jgi:MFS family permease
MESLVALETLVVELESNSGAAGAGVGNPIMAPLDSKEGWIVMIGAFTSCFGALGWFYAFGVFVVPFQERFKSGRGEVSVIYSVMFLVWHLLGPFAGRAADYLGVKKCIGIGAVIFGSSLCLASAAQTLWQLILAQGLLLGIGGAFCSFPVLALAPQWFKKRRALATGAAVTGSGVGNFVYPPLITNLIARYGLPKTLWVMGLFQAAVFAVAIIFVKRRLPTLSKYGQPLDPMLLRNKNFCKLFVVACFYGASAFVPMVHMGAFVQDLGFTTNAAAMAISCFGIGESSS